MAAADRDAVNQSHTTLKSPRTHASQSPHHLAAVKANSSNGREHVRQSPQVKRTTT
jgi:hypothetical protein